jgi:hypothetical protein
MAKGGIPTPGSWWSAGADGLPPGYVAFLLLVLSRV